MGDVSAALLKDAVVHVVLEVCLDFIGRPTRRLDREKLKNEIQVA